MSSETRGRSRVDWGRVLVRAEQIVLSYNTSVTLRQLFYRLVALQVIENVGSTYKRLSALTAQARRDDEFPDLIDQGRRIHRYLSWSDADDAMAWLLRAIQLDRTEGQPVSLYLGVEKAGMVVQLQSWFGDLGIPVVALGGYSSQSYVDEVIADVERSERPAVLIYAGDFDPSGEDIDRDFIERTDCWHKVIRVALSVEQVREYRLPVNPGKVTDSRAAGFIERHGRLMQVELDALDPDDLRALFSTAIAQFWDTRPLTSKCWTASATSGTGSSRPPRPWRTRRDRLRPSAVPSTR